ELRMRKSRRVTGTAFFSFLRSEGLFCRSGDQRSGIQLHCGALGFEFSGSHGTFCATAVSPDSKRYKQKIEGNKSCHISLAADAETVTVKAFSEYKVHAVPRHQHSEKTDDAGNRQPELRPPTCQASMQRQDVTEQRDKSPGLLGVPSPKPAPGIIGPHSTKNCSCRQQQNAQLQHPIKPEVHRRVCARRRGVTCVSPQQNMSETHCQRECGIAECDR